MYLWLQVSTLTLATLMTLNAGQIQIGSGTNGANGLTSSYMSGTSTTSCSGASNAATTSAAGYNGCVTPASGAGNLTERNYVATLFQGATGTTAPVSSTTFSDSNNGTPTFARIQGDLATGQSVGADYWATNNQNTSTVFVPVGIYGVDKVWTMLNDYWGGDGEVGNIQVIFRFDDSSNGLGGTSAAVDEIVNLTNGTQIRSAVTCGGVTGGGTTGTDAPSPCPSVTLSPGSLQIATNLASDASTTIGNASVTPSFLYSSSYTSIGGPVSGGLNRYNYTSGGNVHLDDQLFNFGSLYTNEFLVSVTIKAQLTSGYGTASSTNNYRAALSAVTVDQVATATPEPSTIFLAFAGLGAVGYYRRRKA